MRNEGKMSMVYSLPVHRHTHAIQYAVATCSSHPFDRLFCCCFCLSLSLILFHCSLVWYGVGCTRWLCHFEMCNRMSPSSNVARCCCYCRRCRRLYCMQCNSAMQYNMRVYESEAIGYHRPQVNKGYDINSKLNPRSIEAIMMKSREIEQNKRKKLLPANKLTQSMSKCKVRNGSSRRQTHCWDDRIKKNGRTHPSHTYWFQIAQNPNEIW